MLQLKNAHVNKWKCDMALHTPTRFKNNSCIVVPDHTGIVPVSEKTTKRLQCSCRCVYRSSSAPIRYNIDEAAEKLREPSELCPGWFTLTQQTSAGEANEIWADIIWRCDISKQTRKCASPFVFATKLHSYKQQNSVPSIFHTCQWVGVNRLGGFMQVQLSSGMSSYSPGWRNE